MKRIADCEKEYIKFEKDSLTFVDVTSPYFTIEGINHPNDNSCEWYRLDANNKAAYSEDVRFLAGCTSGATVRFLTSAERIVIADKHRNNHHRLAHMAPRGVHGIDVFEGSGKNRSYLGEISQTFAESDDYNENELKLEPGIKEILINLPLYGGIEYIAVGFPRESEISTAPLRTIEKPFCFYGSSITQGCAASKPSNHYVNIVCREFDAPCLNFGFSGAALGERVIADYIAKKDFSLFVLDYDYNAPTAEHLRNTHFPFYEVIRASHPDTPILMLSHPFYTEPTEIDLERISIVESSYKRALSDGDSHISFIPSTEYFPSHMRDLFAADHLHPTDVAFYFMAQKIIPEIEKLLK